MRALPLPLTLSVLVAAGTISAAQDHGIVAPPTAECCAHEEDRDKYALIWTGHNPMMPIEQLAAYAAPVLWFSPDEPLLKKGPRRLKGKDITIPEPFPFEEASEQPVVYYRVRRVLQRVDEPGEGTYVADPQVRGQSLIDLRKVVGVDLDFFFYYPMDMLSLIHI